MKKYIAIQVIILFVILSSNALGKRVYHDYPDNINLNGVHYSSTYAYGYFKQKAYIEAKDLHRNKLIWNKHIYTIWLNPFIEQDIQWVMIKQISIENGKLKIINENENKFEIKLK